MADQSEGLRRALARTNANYLGVVVGVVLAIVLFAATAVLLIQGPVRPGAEVGPTLGLLENYLPGYTVSWGGAFVGAFWTFLFAFVASWPAAWLYYLGAFHHVENVPQPPEQASEMPVTVARIRIPGFAAAAGLLCGFSLFLATIILVLREGASATRGRHLGLLSNYLPEYTVSVGGAFLGFLYFLVAGGVLFAIAGTIYNALIGPGQNARATGGGHD